MQNEIHAHSVVAIFAGGCFWCLEPVFSQLRGVQNVVSGYIGGQRDNPTYREVCNGDTGHAEAVQIVFDPSQISYATLLKIFFVSHDPTTLNRQGNDVGTQYRSAIFCQDGGQRTTAQLVINALEVTKVFDAAIVTQLCPPAPFYPAEDYHQRYFAKNPENPYCLAVAAPKAAKIRQKYAALIKT